MSRGNSLNLKKTPCRGSEQSVASVGKAPLEDSMPFRPAQASASTPAAERSATGGAAG